MEGNLTITGSLARWTNGGWEGFGFQGSDTIAALAVDGQRVVACGAFTNIGPVMATNVALWNGTAWSPLGEGFPAIGAPFRKAKLLIRGTEVYAMLELPALEVWHWDGNAWSKLPTTVAGTPAGAGAHAGQIQRAASGRHNLAGMTGASMVWWRDSLVAADFPQRSGLFQFQGDTWRPITNAVASLFAHGVAVQHDDLLVHGRIELVEGARTNAYGVARFDGNQWTPMLGTEAGFFKSLQIHGHEFYAVGSHTNRDLYGPSFVSQLIWQFDGRRWSILNGGFQAGNFPKVAAVDGGFASTLQGRQGARLIGIWDGSVWQVPQRTAGETNLFLALDRFIASDGTQMWATAKLQGPVVPPDPVTNVVARLQDGVWRPATTPHPLTVAQFAADAEGVVVAGTKNGESSKPSAVWRWRHNGWSELDGLLPDGTVIGSSLFTALTVFEGEAVVGTAVPTAEGTTNYFCIRWRDNAWQSLGKFNERVLALHASGGHLLVGGAFTQIDGADCPRVAEWDGSRWLPVGGGLPAGTVNAVARSEDGRIAIGGSFKYLSATNLIIYDGLHWRPEVGTTSSDAVLSLAWSGNDLAVGGFFVNGGVESIGFAVWHDVGPKITLRHPEVGAATLRTSGALPARFEIQSSADLAHWITLGTNGMGNPTPTFLEPSTPANQRFFRILPRPNP